MPETAAKRKKITQRWWFPTAVVVLVLLALVGAEEIGLLSLGSDALCAAQNFFAEMAGQTASCP